MSGMLIIFRSDDDISAHNSTSFWHVSRGRIQDLALAILPALREFSPDLADRFELPIQNDYVDISNVDKYTFNRLVEIIEKTTLGEEDEYVLLVLRYLLYMDDRYEGEFDLPAGEIRLPEGKVWRAKGWVYQLIVDSLSQKLRYISTQPRDEYTPRQLDDQTIRQAVKVLIERIQNAKNALSLDLIPSSDVEEWLITEIISLHGAFYVSGRHAGGYSPHFKAELYPAAKELFDLLNDSFGDAREKWLHIMVEDGDLK